MTSASSGILSTKSGDSNISCMKSSKSSLFFRNCCSLSMLPPLKPFPIEFPSFLYVSDSVSERDAVTFKPQIASLLCPIRMADIHVGSAVGGVKADDRLPFSLNPGEVLDGEFYDFLACPFDHDPDLIVCRQRDLEGLFPSCWICCLAHVPPPVKPAQYSIVRLACQNREA